MGQLCYDVCKTSERKAKLSILYRPSLHDASSPKATFALAQQQPRKRVHHRLRPQLLLGSLKAPFSSRKVASQHGESGVFAKLSATIQHQREILRTKLGCKVELRPVGCLVNCDTIHSAAQDSAI